MAKTKPANNVVTKYVVDVLLNIETDECHVWPFYRCQNGYGQVRWEGRVHGTSRLVCELAHGKPPSSEHHAAHSCGNGHLGCVNKRHLRWATPSENEDDKVIHGTKLVGSSHPCSKVSDDQRAFIKSMRGKMGLRELSEMHGVSISSIHRIQHSGMEVAR